MHHKENKAYINWSGGKDACMALYECLLNPGLNVDKLVTSVSLPYNRITMHGVSRKLLELQADAMNIPLQVVELPEGVDMVGYDAIMAETTSDLHQQGYRKSVFGDIFLEDLKQYRQQRLLDSGITAVFPIWKRDTYSLVEAFEDLGFRAVVVCANARLLDESFLGREINRSFLADLPEGVDPCGENGEFHSFVFDGPLFAKPVPHIIGEKVLKSYNQAEKWDHEFWYGDLLSE